MTEPGSRAAGADRWVSGFLGRAGVGAGVTVLVSVLPVLGLIAPAIGGGVASWADNDGVDRGSHVGAAAGAMVALLSLPLTFVAVGVASTVSPAATIGVLAVTLLGAVYVIGSAALGGHLVDEAMERRESSTATAETPIERLKRRYVDGEIDDAEFERRLERLVDAERTRAEPTQERESRRESGSSRERDPRTEQDPVRRERETSRRGR